MIRIPTAAVTASALVLALATIGLHAQDLSRYRDFQLGSTVAAVLKASGATAADVKSMQQRPARIQELRWRPSERYNDRMMATESVHEVMFSFYNDQLFRMVIDYDRQRTEGLTDADLIDSISTRYGVPVLQASLPTQALAFPTPPDGDAVIARWVKRRHLPDAGARHLSDDAASHPRAQIRRCIGAERCRGRGAIGPRGSAAARDGAPQQDGGRQACRRPKGSPREQGVVQAMSTPRYDHLVLARAISHVP